MSKLISDDKPHLVSALRDTQKIKGASGDCAPGNEYSIKALNKKLFEPTVLVLFPGGLYECAIIDPRRGFNQSQTVFLLDLPIEDVVENHQSINMWVTPVATNHVEFDMDNLPPRQQVIALNWIKTTVRCAVERDVNVRGGFVARRSQYALRHIGATTVNKSMGANLLYGIAE